eukprot:scaffold34429_cov56-Phaeocystis_antarctica.AAC.1
MFGRDFGHPPRPPGPGMSGAPRVVRRPSSTYVTPSRLAARRAASLNSSSGERSRLPPRRRYPPSLHTCRGVGKGG